VKNNLDFQKVDGFADKAVSALEVGTVHLWLIPLDIDKGLEFTFSELLSDKQKSKMERLPTAEKRRRYIAGRGFLYRLLQSYSSKGADLSLQFGKHGKPSLVNNPLNIQFNYTDTCGYGLFAFTLDSELGVDIESLSRECDFERIIQRRFAEQEQGVIRKGNITDFLNCWVRKEAYGKAMGCGLNYKLSDFVLCSNLQEEQFTSPDGSWQGQQLRIEHGEQKFTACIISESKRKIGLKAFSLIQ